MRQFFTVAACVSALALLAPRGTEGRDQESTLKNVKVLTGLTEQQFDGAMMYMRGSLGVQNATPASKAIRPGDVVKQYLEASGGPAWSRLTTRVVKGRLVTSEPAVYPYLWEFSSVRHNVPVDAAVFKP